MRLFKILSLSCLFLVLGFSSMNVKALTGNETSQYYSVVYDKEQESAVVAKLIYLNRGKDEIKNLKLEIHGTTVRVISAVQEQAQTKTQANCSRYDYNSPIDQSGERRCLEYSESQTIPSYTYALLDTDSLKIVNNGLSITLDLALKQPIASQKTGTVILYYKTQGMANKVWNGYQYSFETIKSPYDIDNVRVAIDVADDLYIKETAEGTTNYQSNITSALPALSSKSFSESASFKDVSSRIISAPGVTKETSSLDPNENFRVEGKYYNNNWMGELPTIIGVGLTFVVILVVLLVILKSEKKKN
ncbi:MAG: hypothetical protein US31_C0001G0063 [Berkelbacteria bacterium GW2011_GWA1_36_9]|uniref:Uncharacterized protein n=1 Tax=Berkelbacteria bacterium GW2011_GWA1_36_9 TaxID=1618331 RepID=A0A0G0IS88_9BACT|nr:MAG: hypothetical protein US31_C0001G0063 [Berkelbacteria bacterium GW2011_GWA1_36_9]